MIIRKFLIFTKKKRLGNRVSSKNIHISPSQAQSHIVDSEKCPIIWHFIILYFLSRRKMRIDFPREQKTVTSKYQMNRNAISKKTKHWMGKKNKTA
jgi:hypothetical protein